MADFNVTYPKDSIVIVQNLSTFTGGRTIDVAGNVNEVVEAGAVVQDNSGTLEILQAAKAETAALTGASSVRVYKGHTMKVGDAFKGVTITAIDTSASGYDTISGTGTFGAAVTLNEVVINDGSEAIGIVVTTKVISDDNKVDVGVMYRGEVNSELVLVDSDVKTALPLVKFIKD